MDAGVVEKHDGKEVSWLPTAFQMIKDSASFKSLCRAIVVKAEEKELVRSLQSCVSDGERDLIVDGIYRELRESGESRAFENTLASVIDEQFSIAIEKTRRRNTERGLAAIAEREACEAISSIVQRLESGPSRTAALRALLGRSLPARLRTRLWLAMLSPVKKPSAVRAHKKHLVLRLTTQLLATASTMPKSNKPPSLSPERAQTLANALIERSPEPPPEVCWLALQFMAMLDDQVIYRGLDAALDLETGLGFILLSSSESSERRFETSNREEGLPMVQDWRVPRVWMERFLYLVAEADNTLFEALLSGNTKNDTSSFNTLEQRQKAALTLSEEEIDQIARISVGSALRSGLTEVLSLEATIFVWDQCLLTTPEIVLPLAAACLFIALKAPILRLFNYNSKTKTHDLLRMAGPDLRLLVIENLFRRYAMPRVRNDCLSARSLEPNDSLALNITQLEFSCQASSKDNFAFVPSTAPLIVPGLDEPLFWPTIEPANDDLATIVHKVLSEKSNSSTVVRNCALEVVRYLPGVLALSALPPDLQNEFEILLEQNATRIQLCLQSDPGALFLGIEPPSLTVILPSAADRGHAEAAVVWALRSASQGLWPKLMHDVSELADRVLCVQLGSRLIDDLKHEPEHDSVGEISEKDLSSDSKQEVSDDFNAKQVSEERSAAIEDAMAAATSALDAAIVAALLAHKQADEAERKSKAYEAARIQILLAVEATQKKAFGAVYTKEKLQNLDAKGLKNYTKKYSKWVKEFKKRYAKDVEIQALIPDLDDAFFGEWKPPPAPIKT